MNKKQMKLQDLIGLYIKSAYFCNNRDCVYLRLSDKIIELRPEGDCCAQSYIQHVSLSDAFINCTINDIEDLEYQSSTEDNHGGCTDVWGHRFHTSKGTCTIDLRTEHNGYYSGMLTAYEVEDIPENSNLLEDF